MSEYLQQKMIDLLAQIIFHDGRKYWQSLASDDQLALCGLAVRQQLAALFYRMLADGLPMEYREKFKNHYHNAAARTMQNQLALTRFCRMLTENQLRFAPIKGAAAELPLTRHSNKNSAAMSESPLRFVSVSVRESHAVFQCRVK